MASVDNAASTDGAPLLALFRLEARRALKAVISSWLNRGAKLVRFHRPTVARMRRQGGNQSAARPPLAQGAAIIMISSHLQSPTSPPTCRASLGQATFIARHAHSHATLEIRLMEAIDA